MKKSFLLHCIAICFSAVSTLASAQYPSKPVRLIVPFPAGGPSDAAARMVGKVVSKSTGQPMIIDNRPGGNGVIAAQTVMNAPSDGHTLLYGVGSMAAIPLLLKNPPFDSFASFTPVSKIGIFPFGMFVHPGVPAKTIDEFIKHARAHGDKLNYASGALGEFMAAAQFMKASATAMTRVPYKGGAQAMVDLLAGRVSVHFTPVALGLQHVKEGRLRMLGIFLSNRSSAAPEVPTMAEAGMPGVSVPSWQAILGPPRMPREITERISREVHAALRDPEVVMQADRLTLHLEGSSPQSLADLITQSVEMWRVFIVENDIPIE